MRISCRSFGFKHGNTTEYDLVFDVRCLPNPFYDEELKEKTGLEKSVKDYVLSTNKSRLFLEKLISFLGCAIPLYEQKGKEELIIAVGCTGGKHRSVTVAELIKEHFEALGYECSTIHRDINKR